MKRRICDHPRVLISSVTAVCLGVFLASLALPRADNQLTGSDGTLYFAYLPAVIVEHTLDFTNVYATLRPYGTFDYPAYRTPTGMLDNKYQIGTPLLWSPFFLVAHALALTGRFAGLPVAADGVSWWYQAWVLAGTLAYGVAGVVLVYRVCARQWSREVSLAAVVSLWLGTNLVYYMVVEGSMSHVLSFFSAAALVAYWLHSANQPALRRWLILGALVGLSALIRPQDTLIGLLPASELAIGLVAGWRSPVSRWRSMWTTLCGVAALGIGALIAFLPQLVVWQVLYGRPFIVPYVQQGEGFLWTQPHLLDVLFSLNHGLFVWHPLFVIAIAGTILYTIRHPRVGLPMLLVFLSQLFVISTWWAWSQAESFGSRMLISTYPFMAIGLAAAYEVSRRRLGKVSISLVVLAALVWNGLFMVQYRFDFIPRDEAITAGQLLFGKIEMLGQIVGRVYSLIA